MRTAFLRGAGLGIVLFLTVLSAAAGAMSPNPIQSAYWRFEEGTNFGRVSPRNAEAVLDSINDNDMRAFMNPDIDAAPTYVNTVPDKPLSSGLANTLALDFIANPAGGGQDIFALEQEINNGIIASGGGFTVEAAFNTNNPARWAAIVSKEGQPGGSRPIQTFVLKTRGDNSHLTVEQWDANANLVQVNSLAPIVPNQWYYAAVVNDGSNLSLYLDSGAGYELQQSVAVNGALYQGPQPSWDANWTIGRGQFNGHPADWFDGVIDEVRLTNLPLPTSQYLFAEPGPNLTGDYNNDGKVDAADYVVWRDRNINGQQGYLDWRANFGRMAAVGGAVAAVPEPGTILPCVLGYVACALRRRKRAVQLTTPFRGIRRMRNFPAALRLGMLVMASALSLPAMADVPPNPLQSAYWRFEEGAASSNVNHMAADPVRDSINQNHMDAFNADTAPLYTTSLPPRALRSGLSNALALDFIPHAGGGDDLFTLFNTGDLGKGSAKNINNGIIAAGGGFTIEAAFNTNNPLRWAAVVGKEARPGAGHPVQTLVLKTRGDNAHLMFEQWDANGNLTQVNSLVPIVAGQWYQAAVVNTGSQLSMYLDLNNGMGYQLQSSVPVMGALFQGVPANALWDASWTIGRGQYAGNPADWFDGIIDEVRLTNSALLPTQFLFVPSGAASTAGVPEPAGAVMLALAIVAFAVRRVRRS